MAVDTAQKRMSAIAPASPWRGPMVAAAEVGFTQGNRQAAAFHYSGVLAAGAAPSAVQRWQRLALGLGLGLEFPSYFED